MWRQGPPVEKVDKEERERKRKEREKKRLRTDAPYTESERDERHLELAPVQWRDMLCVTWHGVLCVV